MRAMPVKVEEVAILEPQAFTLALQVGGFAPQRPPQGLQVRIAEAEGWSEGGRFSDRVAGLHIRSR
ncbi:hypothetical protein D3C76_1074760 [compost metagenome]